MKKLILLLTLITLMLCVKAADTVYIYQDNSMIKISGVETSDIYLNPSSSAINFSGTTFRIYDGVLKRSYILGTYDEIFDIDTIGFASNSAVLDYLTMFIGNSESQFNFGFTGNLDTTINAIYTVNKDGYNTMAFRIIPPGGGAVAFEASFDGVNYESITFRGITSDVLANSASDTGNFIGSIAGVRAFRFKTSSAGTSTLGTVKGTMMRQIAVIENVEFNAPPHRFGYAPVLKALTLTDADTVTIWLPASGKRFAVTDFNMIAGGNTDAVVKVYSPTDTVFNSQIDVVTNKQFSIVSNSTTPWIGVNVNDSIVVSTSAGIDITITLLGYEY